jgi:hypothetical protein
MTVKPVLKSLAILVPTLMSFSAFADSSPVISVTSSYIVGHSAGNEALAEAFDNVMGANSAPLKDKVESAIAAKGYAQIAVESATLDHAIVMHLQKDADGIFNGASIYTLKSPVSQECSARAKMSVNDRIQNCYVSSETAMINSNNVITAISHAKAVAEKALIAPEVVSTALRSFGLEQSAAKAKESLIVMRDNNRAAVVTLYANGYRADLFQPLLFSKGEKDLKSEKILSALLFLNAKRKAFVDVNLGGAKIVDLDSYTPPKFGTFMGYDLEQSLTTAMMNAGFNYKPSWD